jgi:hypothetical protein
MAKGPLLTFGRVFMMWRDYTRDPRPDLSPRADGAGALSRVTIATFKESSVAAAGERLRRGRVHRPGHGRVPRRPVARSPWTAARAWDRMTIMRGVYPCLLVAVVAACAHGETGIDETGGSGTTASSTTTASGTTSGTSSGGTAPTNCTEADGAAGCCLGSTLYYCKSGSTTVTPKACTGGNVCGWNSTKDYYDCVTSADPDPSGTYPRSCP